MFDPKQFAVAKAKPLPLYLLLDVSSSMSGEKINNLNQAVKDLIQSLAGEEKVEIEILISIITFGNTVDVHLSPTSASQVELANLNAYGMTPMGGALKMTKGMIEDKEITPSRAYRPTVVLISDGMPTDSWEQSLDDFINSGRSSKCDRMAMAIGSDADESVLKQFIAGTEHNLFNANDAKDLHKFFQYVTMSVTTRTRSKNANEIPKDSDLDLSKLSPSDTVASDDNEDW